ncbi:MAG: non-ribosomal peptide synthetase, partial [Gammaproteobacteria bacterium]|nr:non-ribosomal peptide synthetase [Gammaproteobacteria bacterium]
MWLLDRLDGGNQAYRIPFALRLTGTLDVDALTRSIEMIVDRHESLRTRFGTRDESPVQFSDEEFRPRLEHQDLDDVEPAQRESELYARFRELSASTLDLERGPLMRLALVHVDTTHHALIGVMHHIVSDAGSIAVFVKELALLYQANVDGAADPLPALDIQYGDFASWQRQQLDGGTLSSELDYWREKLAGLPALEMPTDRPRPRRQGFSGRGERCVLDAKLSDTLRSFSAKRGTTLFVTLLTAFAAVLHRTSAQVDLAIGTAVSNRDRKELEGLIGLFVNLLVLRIDASGNPSLDALHERVREAVLEAFGHGRVPFEMLVRELKPDRDPARNPLAQVQFSMQSARG